MTCPDCGHDNRDGARFCRACGASLVAACASCRAPLDPAAAFCDACGAPVAPASAAESRSPTPSPAPALPSAFAGGRYDVQRFLGEGGRKRVYLARDARLDRDVALAVIKTEGLDEAGLARVRREAQAMGRLGDHPHIVTIHDIGDDNGQPYIVSQYMAGGALEDLLRDEEAHRLGLDRALALALQITQGLAHAHSQGVVHRDIKPGNIWLTQDGTAKLGDFGLAVALDRSRLTMAGTMVGTAAYMPPEQALGGQADARSDLYSLGCVLYEMLAGRPPFLGDDTLAIISQHVNAPPLVPSWHNPEVSPVLDTLVLRLLAKSPDDRPASAADVATALESIASAPVEAPLQGVAAPAPPAGGYVRSPFVGRSSELEELKGRMEAAMSGKGGLVMVVGEPGIGKTRLTEELSVYARMRGAQVLFGQCYESEGAPPYIPFIEALRQYVGSRPAEALRSELGDAASDVAKLVSEVRTTLPDIPHSPEQEPEAERYRLLEAVTSFMVNASTANPLLVVLDDLHWADKPSLLLLQHLARRLPSSRILAVGTYRDIELDRRHPLSDVVADLRRERLYERILLRGLDEDGVLALLEGRAGHDVQRVFAVALQRQTEGNPFFIEEITLHLLESGALRREEGRFVAADPNTIFESIPEGVREVIGRRLSNLSQHTNDALTYASVLGREFEFDILVALTEMPEDDLLSALEEALSVRLIEEHRGSSGAAYRFSHALVRETLYGELSIVRKQRFHLRAGEAIELARAGRLEPYTGQLANHFYQGNEPIKAIDYCRRAGEASVRVYAWEEALKHWEAALELMEEHGAPDEELAQLLERTGDVIYSSGVDFERGYDFLERALAIYERLGARGKAAAIHSRLGRAMVSWAGAIDVGRAMPHLEAAHAILEEEAPGSASLAYAYLGLALAYSMTEGVDEGLKYARLAREIGEKLKSRSVTTNAIIFEGLHLVIAGRFKEGFPLLEEGYRVADESEFALLAFTAAVFLSTSEGNRMNPRAAREWAEAELAKPRVASAPLARFYLLGQLGLAHSTLGEMDEARRIRDMGHIFQGVSNDLQLSSGEWDAVEARLLESLKNERALGAAIGVRGVSLRLADLCYWRGEYERAAEFLKSLGGSSGARLLVVRAELALAEARSGRMDEAEAQLEICRQSLDNEEDWAGAVSLVDLAAGVVLGLRSEFDASWVAFDRALNSARAYGLVWVEGKILRELARTHLARGQENDRADALRLLDEAAAIFGRLGAPRHVEVVLGDKLAAQGIESGNINASIDRVAAAVQSEHPDLKPHAAPDGTVTIMFSDIEGSTEKTDRLGDKAWMEVLREHNAIVREQLKAHGGFEVKSEGDGFMIAFQSAGKALACASAIQRALAERNRGVGAQHTPLSDRAPNADDQSTTDNISDTARAAPLQASDAGPAPLEPILVRIGLHAGEVIKEGEDFFGRNVIVAARVASQAHGGEVLTSSVVKALVEGSDVSWGDRRTVELKGLPGDHEIWAVDWAETLAPQD